MARRNRPINLPAPYLRRVWLDPSDIEDRKVYPYCLPFLSDEFEISFDKPITIIAGENGVGKSTLLEGIAVLAGYDEAGGGKGYHPVDHSNAREESGGELSNALRASWLPRITRGWFFRAESFFSVARYLDEVGSDADFLSYSHGEGFMRFFEERCQRQGIYFFDEPEAALSPQRQLALLARIHDLEAGGNAQFLIATHSPILFSYPGATVLEIGEQEIRPVDYRETEHYQLTRRFLESPERYFRHLFAANDDEAEP